MEESLRTLYSAELAEYSILAYYDTSNEERYINYKIDHKYLAWEDIITYVQIGLDHEFYNNICNIINPSCRTVLVNKYNQLPANYIPMDLEVINIKYNPEALLLRHGAREAFEEMCHAAEEEGIYLLTAISTFRSFNYQEEVYYRKKTPDITLEEYQTERDKVSARAGHSEHQTGLAVDINDLEECFEATSEGKWLVYNSYRFGFILRYPKGKESITGYNYEPWHYRYIGTELAEAVYFSGLTYDEIYARYLY